jgi:hypothetical protein
VQLFPKGRENVPEDTAMLFPKCRLIVPKGANAVPERSMASKSALPCAPD